jgi:hypothetical protein
LPEGISALTIKSVKFTSANGKSIAGTAYFDTANVSDANYNFKFGMAGCSYVVLNCGEGVVVGKSAETATSLRFVLPPATYDSGCTIEITDSNGISLSKTISSFTIESCEVTVVPAAEIVIDSYPKAPESVLANIQWSNDAEGKPGAFDAAKGLPVETVYLGNQTQNLWVTDAPDGYTLNKIATFGKDEANLTYFNLKFTNVKDQIQDGFTIEVLHRRSHQGSFGENGWCGLFGGRDFGLWLASNDGFKWDARIWDGAKDANSGINKISADVWHHTVYIYNAETEKLQVYTDGKLEVDKACGKMRTITSDYLPIGARMFSDGTKIKFPWGGDIALFKIYDETVGKNEISIMYKDIQGQIDALNGARAK